MIKRKFFFILTVALVALVLGSCTQSDKGNVEFLPFQETTDGQWGMISMEGKVLFHEEFKNKPTVVRDGRFFVRTANGTWEMYDATEKPQKIGGEYAHVSGFHNGKALVSEKGKPVSIIDTEGKTIKKLDKIENKEVNGVRTFEEGYAVFMTEDSLYGVINANGDCVIKPQYCSLNNCGDGKFIGVDNKYSKDVKAGKQEKIKIFVLDASGKTILQFAGDKYSNLKYQFTDGLLAVSVEKDGKDTWGIINDKGEYVVKPSGKIKDIGSISGDIFTYNNGEGWGLMNTKGETLIRAKYENLYLDTDNRLVALFKNGDSYEYKFINEKDEQIGEDTYVEATLFSMYDENHAVVKPNDKIFSIIDKNGKQLEGLPDIVEVGTYEGESYVESDYVDLNKIISVFQINQNGILGINYKTSPKEVVEMSVKYGNSRGTKEHPTTSAYWYDITDHITMYKNVSGINGVITIDFNANLSRENYRTKRVIDYEFYDTYWYHDEKIPTGYSWNKVTPATFDIFIYNYGRMHGKMRETFNLFVNQLKKWGKLAKENNGAKVFTLNDGNRALVGMGKDYVFMLWGDLKPVKDIDISSYKDVTEEDNLPALSYGYLNNLFPDKLDEMAAVDTLSVDTAAVE